MKHLVLCMFVLAIIGLLFIIGRYLLIEHRKKYGVCWSHVIAAADELLTYSQVRKAHIERFKDISLSTGYVCNFTDAYDGLIDLDIPFPVINPDWEYFKLLRIKLRNKTGSNFPVYMELLERAIFHYNADTEYVITTRHLVMYVNHIFNEIYIAGMKKAIKRIEG